MIVLLLEAFVPEKVLRCRAFGVVNVVDLEADTFSLRTPNGEALIYAVDEHSRFRGSIKVLDDLQPGMIALLIARELDNGSSQVMFVYLRDQPWVIRQLSSITNVDPESKSFTLKIRQGVEKAVLVDESTRFRSRDGEVQNLEDVEVGMVAFVTVRNIEEGGSLLAVGMVIAT